MNIPDFKIPGTKLPILPEGTSYYCSRKEDTSKDIDVWTNGTGESNYVSFGYIMSPEINPETFILGEIKEYEGEIYYAFRESDIIKLYKEQNPEPAFPERWCIKLTEENIKEVGGYYNKQTGSIDNTYTKCSSVDYLRSHCHDCGKSIMDGKCHYNYRTAMPTKDFPEITTEQFIKYVLKKEERPIVSYKLKEQYVKSCYDAVCKICNGNFFFTDNFIMCRRTDSIKKLKDAGVLDIWFEPVYPIDYKVNDWVVILNTGSSLRDSVRGFFSGAKVGDTVKIEKVLYMGGNASAEDPRYCGSNWNLRSEDFRPATEDEIKAVLEPVLYFGKVEFKLDKINMLYTTKYGPVSLDELQNAIKYILTPPSLGGHSLKIHNSSGYASLGDIHAVDKNLTIGFGCESGTLEELLKLETKIQDYINEKHCE